MPETIAAVLAEITAEIAYAGTEIGLDLATALTVADIGTNLIVAAALYEASTAFEPAVPRIKPGVSQQTVRQAVSPRYRYYGRVKVGGVLAFLRVGDRTLFNQIMLNSGEIDAIEEHWLDDQQVTIDGDGSVNMGRYAYNGIRRIYINVQLGTDSQTAQPSLLDTFDDYDSNCRLRGIANVVLRQLSIHIDNFHKVYNSGPFQYRCVMRASKVWDPRA